MPNSIHRMTMALGSLGKAVAIPSLRSPRRCRPPRRTTMGASAWSPRTCTSAVRSRPWLAAQTLQELASAVTTIYNNIHGHQAGRTSGRDGPRNRATPMPIWSRSRKQRCCEPEAGGRPRRSERISCNRCSMRSPASDTLYAVAIVPGLMPRAEHARVGRSRHEPGCHSGPRRSAGQ